RHDVVVAGVDVEPLAGQGPRADVHHHRQPLARDRVQDLLHEHETLAGGEVGDPAARDREPLTDGRGGVLGLRLEEHEGVAPEVLAAAHDGGVEPAAHGGRAGDRVGPRGLADPDLDVDDSLGPVARGRDPGVLVLRPNRLPGGLGGANGAWCNGNTHKRPFWRQKSLRPMADTATTTPGPAPGGPAGRPGTGTGGRPRSGRRTAAGPTRSGPGTSA